MAHLRSEIEALGKPALISPPLLMADLARRLAPDQVNE
jgi:hypothetical protein